MIRRLLHHSGKPLLSGFDGVSISHTFKVFLFGRNVYTSRSVHSLAGGRLIEPNAPLLELVFLEISRGEHGVRLLRRVREIDLAQRHLSNVIVVPSAEVVNAVGLVGQDGI